MTLLALMVPLNRDDWDCADRRQFVEHV